MIPTTFIVRRSSNVEKLSNRARPNYAAAQRFPGGREIKLALTVQKRDARSAAQRAATQAAVEQLVATGHGAQAHSVLGGGGIGSTTDRNFRNAQIP
jgi:hypothetical protein